MDERNGNKDQVRQTVEQAVKEIQQLKEQLDGVLAWKAAKEVQQLSFPLDFNSQSIIQGFVQVSGASFLQLGGTRGFGIYYGAGDPNGVVPAAQGSIFMNTTGNSTSSRAYVNTDGVTAWAAITTAS